MREILKVGTAGIVVIGFAQSRQGAIRTWLEHHRYAAFKARIAPDGNAANRRIFCNALIDCSGTKCSVLIVGALFFRRACKRVFETELTAARIKRKKASLAENCICQRVISLWATGRDLIA